MLSGAVVVRRGVALMVAGDHGRSVTKLWSILKLSFTEIDEYSCLSAIMCGSAVVLLSKPLMK